MAFSLFYQIPITLVGVFILALLLAALEIGYRVGFKQRKKWRDADSGGGTVALSSMFAILGLILAFTYASGVSRFEVRKQAVISESNALGTAFLRAGLIAEPGSTELKEELLAYARTRVVTKGVTISNEQRRELLKKTLHAQAKLWPALEKALEKGKPGVIEASLVAAINDVLDEHAIRLAAIFDKLPLFVLWMLIFIAAATLLVTGFNAGLSGRISRWRTTALAMVMTGVMLMILDFDRPNDGFILVPDYSLLTVIADMETELSQ